MASQSAAISSRVVEGPPLPAESRRSGGRPLAAGQSPLGHEAEFFVEGIAGGRGVESDAPDAPPAQMLDGSAHQMGGDALAPMLRMHEHHADPGNGPAISGRGYRSGQLMIQLGKKAALWFQFQEPAPILRRLVPPGKPAQRVDRRQVAFGHQPQGKLAHSGTMSSRSTLHTLHAPHAPRPRYGLRAVQRIA